jgi:hypothetical protein
MVLNQCAANISHSLAFKKRMFFSLYDNFIFHAVNDIISRCAFIGYIKFSTRVTQADKSKGQGALSV